MNKNPNFLKILRESFEKEKHLKLHPSFLIFKVTILIILSIFALLKIFEII